MSVSSWFRPLALGALVFGTSACGAKIVKIEAAAPNAVVYLTKGEPDRSQVPVSYVDKKDLPTTLRVEGGGWWIYVDAPYHAPAVMKLRGLSGSRDNLINVQLEATDQQKYLK